MRADALIRLAAAALAALLLGGCAGRYFRDAGEAPPPPRFSLASLPHKELWTGIVFNGNKVGFSRLKVEAEGSLHRLESETSIRLRLLGFDKSVALRSTDVVREDLSLVSFRHHHRLDGSELTLVGTVLERELRVEVVSGGSRTEQRLPLPGKVYPSAALSLHPILAGLNIGSEHRLAVYNGEVQKIAEAVQRVEAWERSPLFEGPAFKVSTAMLGLTSTSWIDLQGRPLLEVAMNGVLVSALEDERTARGYLAAAALNQDEALVQWSLVKPDVPIARARELKKLRVALAGAGSPPSGERQRCVASQAEWTCDIDAAGRDAAAPAEHANYLRSSFTVRPDDLAIARLAREVAPDSLPPVARIQGLLDWLAANVRREAADVFTARDVLDQRRAECQGHAYLYASFARALGMPTRVMNGLVYSEEHGGFLYHTWAESVVDGRWRAVDPTFGQAEADATHIALVEGEEPADVLPLAQWVGRTRVRVLAP